MVNRRQILQSLKHLYLSENRESKSVLRNVCIYSVRYTFHIIRELVRDQCLLRAAALTFTTLMTLIPVVVLLFITFRAFGGFEEATIRIKYFMFQHLLPESVASIQGYIEHLVSDFNAQAVSYVSTIFLIGAAYSLFASIDSSLNVIWRGHHGRRFFNRIVNVWFILTVAPMLLAYSLYLTARLETFTTFSAGIVAARLLSGLTPYILTLISFTLMYKLVPRTFVQWRSAALGSVFAALLWEISKYGFNYFVKNLSNFKLLYGSFLTLPVFLIWINLSWLIILIGAEIAYTFQNLEFLHLTQQQDERVRKDIFFLSEKLGIYILLKIFERYMAGKPVSRAQLATESPGSGWMLDTYLERFQQHNLILVSEEGLIVPARDPATIGINDLMDFFYDHRVIAGSADSKMPDSIAVRLLSESALSRRKTFEGIDLRSYIKESVVSNSNDDNEPPIKNRTKQ